MITINNRVYDGISMKPSLDESLEHFGVKGMKWHKHLKGRLRGGFVKLTRKKINQGLGVNDAIKEKQQRSSKLVKSGASTYRTNETRGTMKKASGVLDAYYKTPKGKMRKTVNEIKQIQNKKEKQKQRKEEVNKKKKERLYKLW